MRETIKVVYRPPVNKYEKIDIPYVQIMRPLKRMKLKKITDWKDLMMIGPLRKSITTMKWRLDKKVTTLGFNMSSLHPQTKRTL